MCMMCTTIPAAAAAGLSLEARQRRNDRAAGRPKRRIRPILVATLVVILLLVIAATFLHSRFPQAG